MYDPQLGRWIASDPYDELPSPYAGMGNNPINEIDPSGGVMSRPLINWDAVPGSGVINDLGRLALNIFTSISAKRKDPIPVFLRIWEDAIGNDFFYRETWFSVAEHNGVSRGASVRHGDIFEESIRKSLNLSKNDERLYPYPDLPTKYFIPDMLGPNDYLEWMGGGRVQRHWHFDDAIIEEVKFTQSDEVTLNDNGRSYKQIIGFIDYLAEKRGFTIDGRYIDRRISDYGVATLIISTPADVNISDAIINYAKKKNVNLYQRVPIQVRHEGGGVRNSETYELSSELRISIAIPIVRAIKKIPNPVGPTPLVNVNYWGGRKIKINWKK